MDNDEISKLLRNLPEGVYVLVGISIISAALVAIVAILKLTDDGGPNREQRLHAHERHMECLKKYGVEACRELKPAD